MKKISKDTLAVKMITEKAPAQNLLSKLFGKKNENKIKLKID